MDHYEILKLMEKDEEVKKKSSDPIVQELYFYRKLLMTDKISIIEVEELVALLLRDWSFSKNTESVVDHVSEMTEEQLEQVLYVLNDIYTYSSNGLVIINDRAYDILMEKWVSFGHDRIIYPDPINTGKQWTLHPHEKPGLVGSLEKTYDSIDLMLNFADISDKSQNVKDKLASVPKLSTMHDYYMISPKYDGISGAIHIIDGKVDLALTRRDGVSGQDITALAKRMIDGKKNMIISYFTESFMHAISNIDPNSTPKLKKDPFVGTKNESTDELFSRIMQSIFGSTFGTGYMRDIKIDYDKESPNGRLSVTTLNSAINEKANTQFSTGYYKVEFLMTIDDYMELKVEMEEMGIKPYANRRSAVAAIINNPKNLKFAKYITIMPLMYVSDEEDVIVYAPPLSTRYNHYATTGDLFDRAEKMLDKIRDPYFPYRVDGVVVFPLIELGELDSEDYMNYAMAYKVNTNVGITKIDYGYMSIGLLGKGVPMLHVMPVDVNETVVTDVSLGSWDKYIAMDLHEDELIEVFSAGDVIPQARKIKNKKKSKNPMLKIEKVCPYCNQKLTLRGRELWCTNEDCPHLAIGKIANFIIKIGGQNIAEGVIENLYHAGLVEDTIDFFTNTISRLRSEKYKGWDNTSIKNLESELTRLMKTPLQISTFVGALAINGVARKKSREIFKNYTLEELYEMPLCDRISAIDAIYKMGPATAKDFSEYLEYNKEFIQRLASLFTLVPDKTYKGTICFTGFRDAEWEDKFDEIGYEVADTVTTETVCVFAALGTKKSTKIKQAEKLNIRVFGNNYDTINAIYEDLKSK